MKFRLITYILLGFLMLSSCNQTNNETVKIIYIEYKDIKIGDKSYLNWSRNFKRNIDQINGQYCAGDLGIFVYINSSINGNKIKNFVEEFSFNHSNINYNKSDLCKIKYFNNIEISLYKSYEIVEEKILKSSLKHMMFYTLTLDNYDKIIVSYPKNFQYYKEDFRILNKEIFSDISDGCCIISSQNEIN